VPSFGDWGFQLASKSTIDVSKIELTVPTQFLNSENLPSLFMFANDELVDKNKLYTNTLSRPQLIEYYLESEKNWR
jgi:spermidine synthase